MQQPSTHFHTHKARRSKASRLAIPIAIACVGSAALLLAARPASTTSQDARGKPVSIAIETTPYGMSLFRLWGNGDMEVMVLNSNNVWSDWQSVGPGKSGYAPASKPD